MPKPRSSQECSCILTSLNIFRTLFGAFQFRSHTSPFTCASFILFCGVALVCFSSGAYGQSSTATLSGAVEDQNGAHVVGASIALINSQQGTQRLTTTNGEGAFVFVLLPPGRYSVTATASGFAPVEIRDVVLNVNDQRLINIQLNIGSLTQTVEIVDGASLINESPTVGTVVDRQFVANLPLNGRSFQSLINLTPGVVLTRAGNLEQGQFSVNGQRANSNYFTVDGVSANIGASAATFPGQAGAGSLPGLTAFGGTNNLVSVDALQEFRIQTSSYAPEFGRTPGAQVSIVTRTGTNEFNGTLFYYLRNDVFDANDWFANRARLKKPALRQNDFGGVLGGPLYLPRFGEGGRVFRSGENRSFFFLSYEGLRLRQPQVLVSTVPSLAARQAAAPSTRPFLDIYPKPNGPEVGPTGLATFSSSFSNPATLNAFSIRLDGSLNSKSTLFGRYNYAPSETIGRGGVGQSLNTLTHSAGKTQTFTVGTTYAWTSNISNDLRFNYSSNKAATFFTIDEFGGAVVPTDLSPFFPGGRSPASALFNQSINNAQLGLLLWGLQPTNLQRQFNVVDSVSAIKGDHQIKFGVDYRRLLPVFYVPNYTQQLVFSSVGNPAAPPAGSVLSGRVQFGIISSQTGPQEPIFDNVSLYAQDTWRIANRIVLTYGLRWDVNPSPREANGNDPRTLIQINDPSSFALAPRGTPLWKTTYNNFAPRIGAAYHLSRATGRELVLRGGFGVFYDLGNGPASNAFVVSFPVSAFSFVVNAPIPLSSSDAGAPVAGANPGLFDQVVAFDPKLKLPRVYQWNLSVERSLGANQSVTASYVAAIGRRLLRLEMVNNPNAALRGQYHITRNSATSDYHALQIQFQRRLSGSLQALASYNWSKSLDIASNDSASGARSDLFDARLDRGPSDFDVRHTFSGAFTYSIPAPKTGVSQKVLGDWAIDGILFARSATPVNVGYSRSTTVGTLSFRPDLITGVPLYVNDPTVAGGKRINSAAFAFPTNTRQGTLGRNALRGFGVWQFDLALHRHFTLRERLKLRLGAEFFNIFNHPNFGDPSGGLGSLSSTGVLSRNALFGQSTLMLGKSLGAGGLTGGFNPLYQVGGPRSIQLSLKAQF